MLRVYFWFLAAIRGFNVTVQTPYPVDPFRATAECSQQRDCDSCYSHSALCHWCADDHGNVSNGTCFPRFSGCQVGASCAGDDCGERRTCSSCSMGGCKWCGGGTEPPCVAMYSWQCGLPAQCLPNSECIRTTPEFIGYPIIPKFLLISIFAGFFFGVGGFFLGRVKLGFFFFSLALALSVAALLKPEVPEVSVCNAEVQWKNSLISLATKGSVNMEILISVHNPNRYLSAHVRSIDGLLNYRKLFPVGNFRLANLTARSGFVTDQVGVLEISTSADYIAQMLYDFNVAHSLVFTVDPLVVDVELSLFSWLPSVSILARLPPVLIDANKPPLQRLCRCHQTEVAAESVETMDG